MNYLTIAIIVFIILETTNVLAMYFWPESIYANSVGVFKAFEDSKKYPEIHQFIRYLVYWVAGCKLIMLILLVVILTTTDTHTHLLTGCALVLSIGSYFWRLSPIVCKLDKLGQMTPKGYSKALNYMIGGFMTMFTLAVLSSFL